MDFNTTTNYDDNDNEERKKIHVKTESELALARDWLLSASAKNMLGDNNSELANEEVENRITCVSSLVGHCLLDRSCSWPVILWLLIYYYNCCCLHKFIYIFSVHTNGDDCSTPHLEFAQVCFAFAAASLDFLTTRTQQINTRKEIVFISLVSLSLFGIAWTKRVYCVHHWHVHVQIRGRPKKREKERQRAATMNS